MSNIVTDIVWAAGLSGAGVFALYIVDPSVLRAFAVVRIPISGSVLSRLGSAFVVRHETTGEVIVRPKRTAQSRWQGKLFSVVYIEDGSRVARIAPISSVLGFLLAPLVLIDTQSSWWVDLLWISIVVGISLWFVNPIRRFWSGVLGDPRPDRPAT